MTARDDVYDEHVGIVNVVNEWDPDVYPVVADAKALLEALVEARADLEAAEQRALDWTNRCFAQERLICELRAQRLNLMRQLAANSFQVDV